MIIASIAYGATIDSLVGAVNKVVINPLISLLFAVALAVFIWGVAKYLTNPENETIRKESKAHMMWGVVGMFIMISVFGIMRIVLNTLGEKKIKVQNTGEVSIDKIDIGKEVKLRN